MFAKQTICFISEGVRLGRESVRDWEEETESSRFGPFWTLSTERPRGFSFDAESEDGRSWLKSHFLPFLQFPSLKNLQIRFLGPP